MLDNINEKYKRVREHLLKVSKEFADFHNIELTLDINSNFDLNAMVYLDKDKDNLYHIELYSGCFCDYLIEDITSRFDENDLLFFEYIKGFSFLDKRENDTYREELNNLFSSTMIFHIFFHECGHIYAGHVSANKESNLEFEDNKTGSYESQEREMIADWFSTKEVMILLLEYVLDSQDDMSLEELVVAIKQIVILHWLTLSIEFQLFENKHANDKTEQSRRTHPHPSVRLFYNIEGTIEAVNDFLRANQFDSDIADLITDSLISSIQLIIYSFLSVMNTPLYKSILSIKTIDYYIKLREVSAAGESLNKYKHLPALSDNYREKALKYLEMI